MDFKHGHLLGVAKTKAKNPPFKKYFCIFKNRVINSSHAHFSQEIIRKVKISNKLQFKVAKDLKVDARNRNKLNRNEKKKYCNGDINWLEDL